MRNFKLNIFTKRQFIPSIVGNSLRMRNFKLNIFTKRQFIPSIVGNKMSGRKSKVEQGRITLQPQTHVTSLFRMLHSNDISHKLYKEGRLDPKERSKATNKLPILSLKIPTQAAMLGESLVGPSMLTLIQPT